MKYKRLSEFKVIWRDYLNRGENISYRRWFIVATYQNPKTGKSEELRCAYRNKMLEYKSLSSANRAVRKLNKEF